MKDLQAALRPLLEAMEGSNSQLAEVHNMLTNLHTKMDLFEQKAVEVEEVPKKVAKKVTKRKPRKKAAATDDEEETPKTKAKAVKRKPRKKGAAAVDEPDETDATDATDDEDADETDASESKKPVKRVKAKAKTKKKAVKTKKTRLPNKKEYFYKMYDADQDYFSTYIKADDVAQIEEDNEGDWEDLEGDALHKVRRDAFYNFMKDNHDKTLKAMKEAYHEELTNVQPVIATKE